ncbi:hypothetical protein [Streptomyces africanus]|uniref:hypothetical protein n=1 Tax=Streptomyces africanus TaxID=231024 RepID=UPI000A37D8EF|nr:hypothetical protein [Streptomyces africanus]
MDWRHKETAERSKRIAAARQWAECAGKEARDGFPEWYEDTGRADRYTDAYAAWLASPARIERWAERSGIFVGKGFAKWYLGTERTDTFAEAYEVYRDMLHAEIAEDRARRAGR